MPLLPRFLLSYGRISRGVWLSRLVSAGLLCAAFGMLAGQLIGETGSALFALLFVWSAAAVSIQRLHDVGRSGWAMLALLLPVAGPLWVVLILCRGGDEGANRHGRDPQTRLDYLSVDINKIPGA